MNIKDLINQKKAFSVEVFPPKRDGDHFKLLDVITDLKEEIHPDFISVTYGAGGSTRSLTQEIASEIKNKIGVESMAHLTCVGNTKEEIGDILEELKEANIKNILALRGDAPEGKTGFKAVSGGFEYASELVEYIRKEKNYFSIGVAAYPEAHPEAKNLEEDVKKLKIKVGAGSDFVVTQLFFDNQYFYDFMNLVEKHHIKVPIIPGIFIISSYKQLKRLVELSNATIPKALEKKLYQYQDNIEDIKKIGIDYALEQTYNLVESKLIDGVHFYIMNKKDQIVEIYKQIKDIFK